MTAQDCALLIGAVAAGVATCLGAVGLLWIRINQHQLQIERKIQAVVEAVNGNAPK
jgi:nitrate reductase gamma subunit